MVALIVHTMLTLKARRDECTAKKEDSQLRRMLGITSYRSLTECKPVRLETNSSGDSAAHTLTMLLSSDFIHHVRLFLKRQAPCLALTAT